MLKKAFNLPSSLKLIRIHSHPQSSSMFGREGLCVFAEYSISPEQIASLLKLNQNLWQKKALFPFVEQFYAPPKELIKIKMGSYAYCRVGWREQGKSISCFSRDFFRMKKPIRDDSLLSRSFDRSNE